MRNSRNRPRGTMVKKPIIVDRETIREYLVTRVIPTIAAAWPEGGGLFGFNKIMPGHI